LPKISIFITHLKRKISRSRTRMPYLSRGGVLTPAFKIEIRIRAGKQKDFHLNQKQKIIDSHIHIHFNFERSVKSAKKIGLDYSPEGLLRDLKENNIVKAVIMSTFSNNFVKKFVKENSEYFWAAATINPLDYTKQDLEALEADIKKGFFKAIKLYPGYLNFYPSDDICDPIYKIAIKYKIPVFFHSGDTSFPDAMLKYAHPFNIDELAYKFPKLRIIISHLGNPWINDTKEVISKNPNVYADLSGLFPGKNSPYKEELKRKLLEQIEEVIYYAGTDKLLFGTDYSLVSHREYIEFIKKLRIRQGDFDKIFYKNAIKLFGKP